MGFESRALTYAFNAGKAMSDEKNFKWLPFTTAAGLIGTFGAIVYSVCIDIVKESSDVERIKELTASFRIWFVVGVVVLILCAACFCSPRFLDWLKNVKDGIVWFFRNVRVLSSPEFTNSIATRFDEKIKALENRTNEVEKSTSACDATLEETADKTTELERGVDELRKDVLELDKKVEAYGSSFNGITDQTTELKDDISELRKKFEAYSAAYEKRLRTLEEALKRVESPLESWDVAEAGARRVLTINEVEFAFRYCPAGSFTMGSPSSESGRFNDERQREVRISEGFWIFETPTTQSQWDAVDVDKMEECRFNGGKLPVERVTWYESAAFIEKLNDLGISPEGWCFALPSEEQWEYACRAGTSGSTYGVPLDEAAWYDDNSGDKTHEVGTKKPNNWGICDMLGNVWEWTSSNYEGGSSFVFRGGSWNFDALFCRPAKRDYDDPTFCNGNLGFRVVLVRSK